MAAAPKATIVNVGQAAGATAALASEAVRFKSLSIYGFSVYAVPGDVLAAQYRQLVSHAVAGDVQLDLEEIPLDSVADAWQRQGRGARRRETSRRAVTRGLTATATQGIE